MYLFLITIVQRPFPLTMWLTRSLDLNVAIDKHKKVAQSNGNQTAGTMKGSIKYDYQNCAKAEFQATIGIGEKKTNSDFYY